MTRVPLILADPDPAAPPVMPPVTTGAGQLYVVPAGTSPLVPFTGEEVNVTPLQTAVVILLIAGLGLTVTVRVKGAPVQVPAVGVIVYVAVWGAFVGLLSVPEIEAALVPAEPPVIPPVTAGAGHV